MRPLRRQPQANALRSVTLPAPVQGMTALVPGSAMPPLKCVMARNMVPGERGLQSRLGSREWVTGLDGAVRTMLPFQGSAPGNNRQFATTATGIWDVSSSTDAPTQVLVFADGTGDAGYGISHAAVNAAGTHFLLYTDEVNGYHVYSEATGTWVKVAMGAGAGEVSGVDPARFVFVTAWGNRVWFVERDTAAAWYLDVNAIYGAATKFNFGSKFRQGGHLVGLWSWTIDGGAGVQDRLVAVSAGGDVVIYEGYDPSDASKISIAGVWSVGAIPAGRSIGSPFGGDLLLLSTLGVIPLSRLVAGASLEPAQYATADITPIFNAYATANRSLRGWALTVHPEDNTLVLLAPTGTGAPEIQIVMSFATRGWFFGDLPMACAAPWDGKLYFGTADGRVLVNDGEVDGVTLADPNANTPVQFSLLSAVSNFGSNRQKRVQFLRPLFRSKGAKPTYRAAARYDWDTSDLPPVAPAAAGTGANAWDSALWDSAIWGGDAQVSRCVRGAAGMGQWVAIAIRGSAKGRATLISVDVHWDEGGLT